MGEHRQRESFLDAGEHRPGSGSPFWGGAAWSMWEASAATYAVAGGAFVLPLLWGLNWSDDYDRAPWLSYLKALGNAIGVAVFFVIITLFVGVGLSAAEESMWGAPVFAGLLALGLAACLFPGTPAHYLMIVLRSAMHFVFILVVAYVGLAPFIPDPSRIALIAASMVTACAALGLTHPEVLGLGGLGGDASWTLALLTLMAVWWVTLAVEPAVTGLIPFVALAILGIGKPAEIAAPYANDVIFLFAGGALIGLSLERTGVSSRFASALVGLAGASPFKVLAAVMTATAARLEARRAPRPRRTVQRR